MPARYGRLFARAGRALASHRGFDRGAADIAAALRRILGAPLIASRTTRLLVDLNRSPRHPGLFSEFTRALTPEQKTALLARHYWPYRRRVEAAIERSVAAGGRVLHVSAHSFTPRLAGEVRRADIGLLYDPRRPYERALCAAWRRELAAALPGVVVRRNYPYRGTADGLVTYLRSRFAASRYAGIELELNQRRVDGSEWRDLVDTVARCLGQALRDTGWRARL